MKKMKKLVCLVLAAVLALAMSVTAFAAEDKTAHTYDAYQVFTGEVKEGKLEGIDWGTGVKSADLLKALQDDATLGADMAGLTTAAEVAAKLNKDNGYEKDNAKMQKFAAIVAANLAETPTVKGVKGESLKIETAGYYLIQDEKGTVEENGAYTRYIIEVLAPQDLTPVAKSDVPEMIKKVQENSDLKGKDNAAVGNTDASMEKYEIPAKYNDVADYNIGDAVPFQIVGTLPTNYDEFEKYYYEFSDSYDKEQFTFNNDVKVTTKDGAVLTDKFTVKENENKDGFTVVCSNLKAVEGVTKDSYIIVDYTMTLEKGCNVGAGNGNENKAKLIFSNNPNETGEGTPSKGETPEDKVVVFTYDIPVEKVDPVAGKKLENVEFKLKNEAGKYVTVDADGKVTGWKDTQDEGTALKTKADGTFAVVGLDDGTYTLIETQPLPGYNNIDDITVVVDADTTNTQAWDGTQSSVSTKVDLTADGKKVETKEGEKAKIVVENRSGSTLPSTGGVGTKMFYLIGAILVIGAGIVLVSRRRIAR
ncbi:MAG: SpaA isopeptide-forming pilin-related protein [Eubacteriales bacterium]|nr:SpaA isopeptide-forming pilin-related protein [Eubacteriales bacterium]